MKLQRWGIYDIWRYSLLAFIFQSFFILSTTIMASGIKDDEIVVFFNTSAYLGKSGNDWHIPIHVWVNEPEDSFFRAKIFAAFLDAKYGLEVNDENKPYFARRTNLLIADNERGKEVQIEFAGKSYQLNKTRENGQSVTIIKVPRNDLATVKDGTIMSYRALLSNRDKREFIGQVKFVFPQGVSVISDIDDTVKVSQVTDHRQLIENTFFKPFTAVPDMASLYHSWAQQGVSIHYVSSSPWQLYPELHGFMDEAGFPWSSYSLKSVRFRDETLMNLFKKGIETKPKQIEPILRAYPGRQFILVGDSGEEDPEVYALILKKYPNQVRRIYIRSVNGYEKDRQRMERLFNHSAEGENGIDGVKWALFKDPGKLTLPH